jgi:hypothetical protein
MKVKQFPLPRRLWTALSMAALCLGMLSLTPSVALAETLPAPTDLRVQHVSDTSADLYWSSSGSSLGDVVQFLVNGSWQQYSTPEPLFGYLHRSDLTPGTTYTFRVYTPGSASLGTTTSPLSASLSFTTLPGPDSVPPTQPPAPTAGNTTTTMTTLSWGPSTDNVQVTGYDFQELENGSWTTVATLPANSLNAYNQTVTGLAPATSYQFAVVAFDARGNRSARSNSTTVTTLTPTQFPACQFHVTVYGGGFFLAYATITNTTAQPLTNWSVSFTMPSTPTVLTSWGGTFSFAPPTGTITPASYDASIAQGAQGSVGFEGSVTPFSPPSAFTLNGLPCTSF